MPSPDGPCSRFYCVFGDRPSLLVILALVLMPGFCVPGQLAARESAAVSPPPAAEPEKPQSDVEETRDPQLYTEEVVVTARRREENLQQIPVSASALSQSMLDERSAARLPDLQGIAPSLILGPGTFGSDTSDAVVFLRGVGQGDTAVFSDPGVGIYLDGVYLARAQGALLDLVDLERVEILRGPQGTLFGKNTTGGAIQLITRRPAREFGGRVALLVGNRESHSGQATVDFALGANLFGSVAGRSAESGPTSRSLADGQRFGDQRRRLLRLSLDYAPEAGLAAFWRADYVKERGTGGNQAMVALERTPLLDFYNSILSEQGFLPYSENFVVDDPRESWGKGLAVGDPYVDGESLGVALDLGSQGRSFSWKSITGYREVDYESSSDADGTPVQLSEGIFRERQKQVSQEFQLYGTTASSDWLVGALYFEEKPREDSRQFVLGGLFDALARAPGPIYAPPGLPNFLCNPGPPPPGLPCFGGAGNPLNFAFFVGQGIGLDLDLDNRSWAVFSETTWRATDRLSLTLGARFSEDHKKFTYVSRNGFGVVDNDLRNEDTWSDGSGRFSLAWQLRPEILLYGNLARGFKSGGFNGRPQSRGVLDPFDPEYVTSAELGIKTDLLDRRLRFNGAIFASEYRNIHFGASFQGAAGEPILVTQNAGEAEIHGLELEWELHPARSWVLTGSASWLDSELVEVDPRVPAGLDPGNELPQAPEWSYALSLQRSLVIGETAALIARADWTHTAGYFLDIANAESVAQKPYGLLAARLSYGPYSGRWEVSLFGRNLTDEAYLASGFVAGAFGPSLVTPGRPREWGGELVLRF